MKNQEQPLLERPCRLKDKPGEAFAEGDVLTYMPRVLHREADAKTHCQMAQSSNSAFSERDPYEEPDPGSRVVLPHFYGPHG